MRRPTIIAAALGSALALAACGGDDGGDREQAARLSAAGYRAQLAQLCSASEQEASQVGGVQGANASALADYFDRIAAVEAKRRERFERLRPPADLQDEHARVARLFGQGVDALRQAAAGFRSGADPVATYDAFWRSHNGAVRGQNKVVETLKVPKCRSALGPRTRSARRAS